MNGRRSGLADSKRRDAESEGRLLVWLVAALFLGSLAAVVAGLLVQPPPGTARSVYAFLVLAAWSALIVVYPLAAWRTGVNFGYGGAAMRRDREPVFFWVWLAIWWSLLLVIWMLGASFVSRL